MAIVPTSAKTGEGISTLLIVLTGLVQQYLQDHIRYSDGPGKGVVLEVKNEPGYGVTLDCLLYDGYIKKGDLFVVGSLAGPVETKVRALLRPKALDEMRDPRNKFDSEVTIYAAAGLKILAPNLENVVAGSPFRVVDSSNKLEEIKGEIEAELNAIQIKTEKTGVIIKADALGSLEALVGFLQDNGVKIHKASVGPVTRTDVINAAAIREKDPIQGVVLAFSVKTLKDAQEEAEELAIRIFSNDVIYRLLEEYETYVEKRKAEDTAAALSEIVKPGKFQVLPNYIFHQSNPAIFGVKVLAGEIQSRKTFMRAENGEKVGIIHQIQDKGQSLPSAKKGEEVAVSVKNITIGRQLKEDDTLFIIVPESHVRLLMGKYRDQISGDHKEALREYVQLMRKKTNAWWGA
ncbi:MAG: translation initiation factor IF-2 [Promethearchaeota archaeon CR_4]|nr:MAG: translation initiation factor IF-2 [Candidatus Lokiarchaeota archaeon CR_4]